MQKPRTCSPAKATPVSRLAILLAVLALSSAVAFAQDDAPAARTPARRADDSPGGPAPVHDLSGTWTGPDEAQLTNDIPQMTAAGQARLKLNVPDPFSATSNDPWKTCDPFGLPRAVNNQTGQIGFAQMPDRIVILEGFEKIWREVWMDGRELPKNVGHKGGPSTMFYGYSVGHWEGDTTLVVDTIGMDPSSWIDRRGYPHSVDAHVIERYTRVDHNHLNVTETLEDPAYYAKPFLLAKNSYRWVAGQDDKAAPIPFSAERLCVASDAIEYMNLVAAPADEDSAVGNKTKK